MSELHRETAAALGAALSARQLSAHELNAALLDRIGRLDPLLGTFNSVFAHSALAAARACDENHGPRTGRLAEIPVAVKDNILVRGRDAAGLPIGLQLIAPAFAEDLLFDAAEELEPLLGSAAWVAEPEAVAV